METQEKEEEMNDELTKIRQRIETLILVSLAVVAGVTDGTTPYVAVGMALVLLVSWTWQDQKKPAER